ncbi:hypothetical protein PENCOP_c007G02904 [Penicillium coprophilum]|uniref:Uncharacterized protein n=1 Tax=Penicillium coprophilum TaxID=36646 RepID=A0A1V6UKM0_9EURO|nr:hypothetical protein PENCOP_c007G02904 [Penicillium coprophilum]
MTSASLAECAMSKIRISEVFYARAPAPTRLERAGSVPNSATRHGPDDQCICDIARIQNFLLIKLIRVFFVVLCILHLAITISIIIAFIDQRQHQQQRNDMDSWPKRQRHMSSYKDNSN